MSDVADSGCSLDCGYISSGLDLWLHERYEHADCPECGARPDEDYSVTHRTDPPCPRLSSDYVYPGPVPAGFAEGGQS